MKHLILLNQAAKRYKVVMDGNTTNDPRQFLDGSYKPHFYPEGFSALVEHPFGSLSKHDLGPDGLERMVTSGISREGGHTLNECDKRIFLPGSKEIQAKAGKERTN